MLDQFLKLERAKAWRRRIASIGNAVLKEPDPRVGRQPTLAPATWDWRSTPPGQMIEDALRGASPVPVQTVPLWPGPLPKPGEIIYEEPANEATWNDQRPKPLNPAPENGVTEEGREWPSFQPRQPEPHRRLILWEVDLATGDESVSVKLTVVTQSDGTMRVEKIEHL